MNTRPSRDEQRDRLLEAALVHVPFDGWSRRSLQAGARDAGVDSSTARLLFPRGGDDLLAHVDSWADRRMLARIGTASLEAMRVRDRITTLVRARLESLTPHREAMRRAVAAGFFPTNALNASANLWRTVDLMWSAAGDHTTDANYYTKRLLLAGVWVSTFFYWLDDRSPNLEDTWAFLARRIDDVMRIGNVRARIDDALRGLSRLNPLRARSW